MTTTDEPTPRISASKSLAQDSPMTSGEEGSTSGLTDYITQPLSFLGLRKAALTNANRSSRSSSRQDSIDDRDETSSVVSCSTELSTRAEAGSDHAPDSIAGSPPHTWQSPPGTPMETDRDSFVPLDSYEGAPLGVPPQINLEPRTHPLAGGEAQHGGVLLNEESQAKLDEDRAEGRAAGPAYNDVAVDAEEDDYSSDEQVGQLSTVKRVKRKVKSKLIGLNGRDDEEMQS
ncbi:unnamed protein product [Mycena citricolor]|uniref:Uncharacterized protein n=1 Tax=Mycena citricolor TaxID=2018698 RepID=A0AAD2H249_9AGAR|nr:unnamed protein product [Mycena citricolor]